MNTAEQEGTRAFVAPDEGGNFPAHNYETIFGPVLKGLDVEIRIVEQADGWRAGVVAVLPESIYDRRPRVTDSPAPTRGEAIVAACEALIGWLAEEKGRGGRRHKQLAEELQTWALDQAKAAVLQIKAAESLAPVAPPAADNGQPELRAIADSAPVQLVPTGELYESPWNPRQYYPEAAMAELVESMRASGFRQWLPLMVRPRAEGGYEIGAGHRRRRAAETAGIAMVPCVVAPMTDEQFLDVLNFDNTGREDVHPLHEAAGWRAWMARTGKGVMDIANRIGQSKEYVYQRLKYGALIEPAVKAFLNDEITKGHAILIARLEPKAQEKALKYALAPVNYTGLRPSVRALADHLHESAYVDLRDCPFDRGDRLLVAGAGACGECPKLAANIPGFEFEAEDPNRELCMDATCYQHKVDNHLFRLRTDLEATGESLVTISRMLSTKKKGVHKAGEYELAKPGDKDARTALVVEGADLGKVVKIRLKPPRPGSGPSSGASSAAVKADQEKAEAARKAKVEKERAVRCKILDAIRPKVGGLTRADIEAFLRVVIGDEDGDLLCDWHGIKHREYGGGQALVEALPKLSERDLFLLCVEISVVVDFDEWRVVNGKSAEALLSLAKRYKVDAAKIRREMEDAAKEAEGGTRKEVVRKPAAAKSAPAKKVPVKKAAAKKPATKKAAKKR